jgi:hypothetical protein
MSQPVLMEDPATGVVFEVLDGSEAEFLYEV